MNFEFYVDAFAKALEAQSVRKENEAIISVTLGEYEMFFTFIAPQNTVMLHSSLAVHDEKKETLAYLLEMNTFFAKTYGICLGIDANIITAQHNIYLGENEHKNIEVSVFLKQCENFLEAISKLLAYFNDAAAFAQDVAKANKDKQNQESAPSRLGQDIRC